MELKKKKGITIPNIDVTLDNLIAASMGNLDVALATVGITKAKRENMNIEGEEKSSLCSVRTPFLPLTGENTYFRQ